jgi:hypothetical protein
MTAFMQNDSGYITVLVFILLTTIAVLSSSVSRISRTDLWISTNEGKSKASFYVAEGGNIREAKEVADGSYAIDNIHEPAVIATESSPGLPAPTPHTVDDKPYEFTIEFKGAFPPPRGFSAITFNRYDYEIETRRNGRTVRARYCKIEPKQ